MNKPSTIRGKIQSVWTEQDQAYGNASQDRAFPSNSSPSLMKVEIKDVLPKRKSTDGSPKVEEIWTKQLNQRLATVLNGIST